MKEHIYRDRGKGVPNSQCPEGPGGIGNPFLGPTMRWAHTHELSSMAAIHASDMEIPLVRGSHRLANVC